MSPDQVFFEASKTFIIQDPNLDWDVSTLESEVRPRVQGLVIRVEGPGLRVDASKNSYAGTISAAERKGSSVNDFHLKMA